MARAGWIVLSILLALPGLAVAQSEGVQILSDGVTRLVTKDVGEERWSITRHADGTTSGVVYSPDGSAPSFVDCRPIVTEAGPSLSCWAAPPCDAWPCHGEWSFAGEVELPAGFFAVPGDVPGAPVPVSVDLALADLAGTYELADVAPLLSNDTLIVNRRGAFLWRIRAGQLPQQQLGAHGVLFPAESRGEFGREYSGGYLGLNDGMWLDGPVRPILSQDVLELPAAFAHASGHEQPISPRWRLVPLDVPEDDGRDWTSGVQLGRRGDYRLISKRVGTENWSILRSGEVVSGTVYFERDRAPAFVECTVRRVTPDIDELTCTAAGPCTEAPCEESWTPLRAVQLPADFFGPPGAPAVGDPDPMDAHLAEFAGVYRLEADEERYLSGVLSIATEGHVFLTLDPGFRRTLYRAGLVQTFAQGAIGMISVTVSVQGPGLVVLSSPGQETWAIARDGDTLSTVGVYGDEEPLVWTREDAPGAGS